MRAKVIHAFKENENRRSGAFMESLEAEKMGGVAKFQTGNALIGTRKAADMTTGPLPLLPMSVQRWPDHVYINS